MIPPVASRFVAGESVPAALDHVRAANEDGVAVILNLLGEHYDDPADARADTDAYLGLLDDIADSGLDACVSVKPSQIGMDVSTDLFEEHYREIVARAHEVDAFVWCDMEDADTTDATLDAFESIAADYPWSVGQCVQSNLRRTADDLDRLIDVPGKLRLVKGAYDEPSSIAYTDKARVDEAYRDDLTTLFERRDRGIAVGSHDPEMISLADRLARDRGADYEVQMLMGVREDAQRDLAAQGVDVHRYAPYGDKWLSYFYRRVRERKENLTFAARAVLGQ
ncbi:proline dehydrogenase family protein [Halorubrum ezzemoulense]|jgi:proline dehydrogenase|uniref:proline dehydrogenase n=2 Tax=Halorubrum ezzemoulense TaxID=337243 RepID=A0A256JJK9_HALEZ|nr:MULTISPECIES: proline dehydrogenase family protein [Halorubrum]MDB2238905.1 proline dehydrogenase family protein [Halorubrum ezzemoulense]MDB2242526.1 proline dehydrogenase family protein [Halorubrum ezzemoulense]MDB2245861.1 proline dehydrogenase family protein [Halorubrum ezzemoulense]MDB2249592.1 proline dehydrogenase family protein [Halorubrum ezzemoulense]MDB2252873.1 proline dehydrogenase family protein [Halorubrum ezzemoulense]